MKQLTIRGVEDKLHQTLKLEAKRRGLSLNRYVLSVLKGTVGFTNAEAKKEAFDDLDHLAETWSREEAAEFDSALKEQRQIDEGFRPFGLCAGEFRVPNDFDDPLPEEITVRADPVVVI